MTATKRRVRVLRGFDATDADLGTVRSHGARHLVVDPELVQSASDDGYRTGYQAGFDAGLLDAAQAIDARERQHASELRGLVDQLADAASRIESDHDQIISALEQQAIALAIDIAETLVGRELSTSTNPGGAALVRALQLAPPNGPVTAYLHPDDCATLAAETNTETYRDRGLTIVPLDTMSRGDCIVDVDATRIDARISPTLERLREVIEQ